jgi:uncharacterized membrane protein YidH (DUF202 family)
MKMWTLLISVLFLVFGVIRVGGQLVNQMSEKPRITPIDWYISIGALVVGIVLMLVSNAMKEKQA